MKKPRKVLSYIFHYIYLICFLACCLMLNIQSSQNTDSYSLKISLRCNLNALHLFTEHITETQYAQSPHDCSYSTLLPTRYTRQKRYVQITKKTDILLPSQCILSALDLDSYLRNHFADIQPKQIIRIHYKNKHKPALMWGLNNLYTKYQTDDYLNEQHEGLLHIACKANDVTAVKTLLLGWKTKSRRPKSYPYLQDKNGNMPLHIACKRGNQKIVHLLLSYPGYTSHINDKNNKKETPLHIAVKNNFANITRLLWNKGAIIEPELFHKAVMHNSLKTLKILFKCASVYINSKNKFDLTPLTLACTHNRIEIVKFLLLQTCVNQYIRDTEGMTALHAAIENNHNRILRLLIIRNKTNPNHCNYMRKYNENGTYSDIQHNTPLHMACLKQNIIAITLLLSRHDTDVTIKNADGLTPVEIAYKCKNEEIIALFKSKKVLR